jgi:EmrB/QacA subfamily drug resistance transporter
MTDIPTDSVADVRRQRLILFSIAFATFMVNADSYIVNISLPAITAWFHTDTASATWVIISYQLTVTGLLLAFGVLGDRLGIRRLFMFGYGVFTLSSLVCAMSGTLGWLVAGRALQGVGGAVLYALTPAMVPKYLPASMRGAAFGLLATAAALGISVGTPLGGLLTGYLSWHWAFIINLPIGVAAMLLCYRVIPDDAPKSGKAPPFDYPGAIFSFIALLSLIQTFTSIDEYGLYSLRTILALSVCILTSIAFVWREQHTDHPLIDFSLFRSRSFRMGNVANFLCLSCLAGHNFIVPFYLTLVKGMPAEKAGMVFLIYSLVYMAVGPLSGKLANRIAPRTLCTSGLFLGVLVFLLFSVGLKINSMWPVYCYFVGMAVVMATFIPSNSSVVMGSAPDGKQGAVAGTFRMVGRVGMTFGVTAFQALLALFVVSNDKLSMELLKGLDQKLLLSAFSKVYVAGAVLFGIATVCSFVAKKQNINTMEE